MEWIDKHAEMTMVNTNWKEDRQMDSQTDRYIDR